MPSPRGALVGLLRQADSLAASVGAVASDWKSLLGGAEPLDWLERRDPEHIRRTLPSMKAYAEL
jgi:hypothetical protein